MKKTYWLIFSNGESLQGSLDFAKVYCEYHKCTFKMLATTTIRRNFE